MMAQYSCKKVDKKVKKHLEEINEIKEETLKVSQETKEELEILKQEVVTEKTKKFNLKAYHAERKNPAKK